MSRLLGAACALGVTSAIVGCAVLVDLDPLRGTNVSDAGREVSTTFPDVVDEPVVLDAGPFDATVSFCSKAPPNLFCDDFDEKPLGFDWEVHTFGGGTITYDKNAPTSAPNAMGAALPQASSRGAYLLRKLPTALSTFSIAFGLRIAAYPSEDVVPLWIDIGTTLGTANLSNFALILSQADAYIQDGNGAGFYFLKSPITAAKFHRIVVSFDWTAGTLRITVDGVSQLQQTIKKRSALFVSVQVGAAGISGASKPVQFAYDDVLATSP